MVIQHPSNSANRKRLLFLDDDLGRWEQLNDALKGRNVGMMCWVSSANAAISALKDNYFNVVLLDHDLGTDLCGCAVVDWIVANKVLFKDTEFIIHSWNPDGAEVMQLALYGAGLKSKRKLFHIEHMDL